MLKPLVFKLWSWMNLHKNDVSAHHTDHKAASGESAEFKDVNIPADEAYKQATEIILRIKNLNMFIGCAAGKITTGNYNSFVGYRTGYKNTSGHHNTFVGFQSGYENTTGYRNNFLGMQSGFKNTSGKWNNFMGNTSGFYTTTGSDNNYMGISAGYNNTTGFSNVGVGSYAGYSNVTGYHNTSIGYRSGFYNTGFDNVFIGYRAAQYETQNNKLFIDNQSRANEADGRIKTLIYGIFAAATNNQMLRINAKKVEMPVLGNYANDAAAATGGIAVGGLYRNGTDVRVRVV